MRAEVQMIKQCFYSRFLLPNHVYTSKVSLYPFELTNPYKMFSSVYIQLLPLPLLLNQGNRVNLSESAIASSREMLPILPAPTDFNLNFQHIDEEVLHLDYLILLRFFRQST